MFKEDIDDICTTLRKLGNPQRFFEDPNGGAFRVHDWLQWNYTAPLALVSTGGYTGFGTTIVTNEARRGHTAYMGFNATVNLVWERFWALHIPPVPTGIQDSAWRMPAYFHTWMNRATSDTTNQGERYQGIAYGMPYGVNGPWSTTVFGSSSSEGRIGLHWNFTLARWEVQVYGQADHPRTFPCTSQPLFATDQHPAEVALLWVPRDANARNSRVVALINGINCFELLDDPEMNEISDAGGGLGPGIYWSNGGPAVQTVPDAGYYYGHFWSPIPRPRPAKQAPYA